MSAHLERAQLLLAQSRPAAAEQEAMLALSAQPDNPQALALLALSRVDQGKQEAALEAAREAIGQAAGEPYFHYVHAAVLHRMEGHEDDAFRAIQEALRLAPDEADYFSLLASIELARRNWPASLEAAEHALQLNGEHVGAANLRAMALVRMGRKTEALESVDFALNRAPEDAFSHANQGWNYLHQNNPAKAQEHFREALRLDPTLDYAREGMLEALKARNPVYRGMLAYFLWMGRLSGKLQWAFILAVLFGSNAARFFAAKSPELNWFWWPLLGLFYGFVYLSWTAGPMFNLLLRLNKFGRHVLTEDQRTGSNFFGTVFALGLASLVYWVSTGSVVGKFATIACAALSVCVASTFNMRGKNRMILAAATGTLALVTVAGGLLYLRENPLGSGFIMIASLGFVAFQFLSNALATR